MPTNIYRALDSYSWGAPFHSRPGHQLFLSEVFIIFRTGIVPRWGHDHFVSSLFFQFISHPATRRCTVSLLKASLNKQTNKHDDSPLLGLGLFFSFLILYTVGRVPWTWDQPVAGPLLTHRINAHNTDINALSGTRTHDISVRANENSSCLRPRGRCDRPFTDYA
jgi:hypothetical protein